MEKVSIIGAGNVGATVAQEIVRRGLADVVMLDIIEGTAKGKALDLAQAASLWGSPCKVLGTANYALCKDSKVVVITAGVPRKPGMSRDELLKVNAAIVKEVASKSFAFAPNACFVVVSNPLDIMAYLTWKVTNLPSRRVIGMAGILDSARFQAFIAQELDVSPVDVRAMVLGSHGDEMVPIVSGSTVNGIPLTSLLSSQTLRSICDRTRRGGAEIVDLLKAGSAWYAPGVATTLIVEAILQDSRRVLPCSVNARGKYGINSAFIGLPVVISSRGVEKIVEIELNADEKLALSVSGETIKANIARLAELNLI